MTKRDLILIYRALTVLLHQQMYDDNFLMKQGLATLGTQFASDMMQEMRSRIDTLQHSRRKKRKSS